MWNLQFFEQLSKKVPFLVFCGANHQKHLNFHFFAWNLYCCVMIFKIKNPSAIFGDHAKNQHHTTYPYYNKKSLFVSTGCFKIYARMKSLFFQLVTMNIYRKQSLRGVPWDQLKSENTDTSCLLNALNELVQINCKKACSVIEQVWISTFYWQNC